MEAGENPARSRHCEGALRAEGEGPESRNMHRRKAPAASEKRGQCELGCRKNGLQRRSRQRQMRCSFYLFGEQERGNRDAGEWKRKKRIDGQDAAKAA